MRTFFVASTLLLITVCLFTFEAKACTCGYVTPDSPTINAVFVGKVIKKIREGAFYKLEVEISEIFKGLEKNETVEILHKDFGCGSTLFENKEYLFLASLDKVTRELTMGPCNLSYKNSGQQKQMIEILRWKKNLNNRDNNGLLVGKVVIADSETNYLRKPTGVDKVIAEDELGNKVKTEIESDGYYRFSNLAKGIYKVYVELPKHLTTHADLKGYDDGKSIRTNVTLAKNRGVIEDFYVIANGKISGYVFNSDGTLAVEASVHLINSDGVIDESTETDEFGFYKFEGLPAKQFKIMVGVTWNNYVSPFWKEANYPTTYFPNVDSRNEAVPIKLSEGEIVVNQNITLLPKFKSKPLKGKVILPNGNPVENIGISVQIQVKEKDRTLHSAWQNLAKTDASGNFSLDIYENTRYLIKVEFEETETQYFTNCLLVETNNKPEFLTLKLQKGRGECDEKKLGF